MIQENAIDVDTFFPQQTVLIVEHKTGFEWEAQCGGINCTHPSLKGMAIPMGGLLEFFSGCEFGCGYISEDEPSRKKLAVEIGNRLENANTQKMRIQFDYERIDELQEGWFPVIVTGKWGYWDELSFEASKGYLHTGNCD